MVQCSEKTITWTAIFTKKYDVNFKENGGNFWDFTGKKSFNESFLLLIQKDFPDINLNIRLDKVDKKFQHLRILFSSILQKKSANSNQKSKNSAISFKSRASVFKITKSKFTPASGKNESSREYVGGKEGSNSVYLTTKREVYKQSLSGEQERWRSQADNKPQKFEQLTFIPSFQDGRSKRSKVLIATEQLHVQDRLTGCLFLHSTSKKLPEVYTFSMRREPVQIIISSS